MSNKLKRRDFIKYGLRGSSVVLTGGLSYASASTELHNDKNQCSHPWWVEEVDKPVLAIDDKVYKRFDSQAHVISSFEKYIGREKFSELMRISGELRKQYYKENRPGFRIEDRALSTASRTVYRTGGLNRGLRSWNKLSIRTPQEQGIEKYKKSPKEAANLVKKAARYFGAAAVGITLLDRRHIYSRDYGMDIVFEGVDEPYEEPGKKIVIPDKCKYAVALGIQMSLDTIQCAPTAIGDAASTLGYSRAEFLVGSLAEFIRGLGYTAIPSINDLGSSIAFAVDAGLGELGRTNRLITPEYGPAVRLAKVLTDLPMETDKPINFGIREFCRVCKRCAEACPSKALSLKDEPDFDVKGEWSNPGHQAWFEDATKCYEFWQESTTGCSLCISVCPWTKKDKTIIHSIVKAASAKIPSLDGFFTSMDEAFGYGKQKDSQKWWFLDLPEYGIDTTQGKEML